MGKTFVLIHGTWHAGWAWQDVVQRLASKGYRALAPTLAGHGPGATRLGTPEPSQVKLDRLDLKQFYSMPISKSFIFCRQDRAMPGGYFHPGMSSRPGRHKLIKLDGVTK